MNTVDFVETIQVLTPEEVQIVNAELDKKEFIVSSIGFEDGKTGEPRVDSDIRSSSGCYLLDDERAAQIMHEGMNKALLEYHKRMVDKHPTFDGYPIPGGYMTTSNRELIQVLEYVKNQKYAWHTDASPLPESKEYHRKISIILYLSDGFEGGVTEFIGHTHKPPVGHALIFPSNWCFPHTGTQVTSGKKRVAVTWYYVNDITWPF